MNNAIREILRTIPSNHIFDTHFVINFLIKEYSDEYLQFAARYANSNQITLTTHGQIGQIISSFQGDLVEQLDPPAWSENIHWKASPCACWRKL